MPPGADSPTQREGNVTCSEVSEAFSLPGIRR